MTFSVLVNVDLSQEARRLLKVEPTQIKGESEERKSQPPGKKLSHVNSEHMCSSHTSVFRCEWPRQPTLTLNVSTRGAKLHSPTSAFICNALACVDLNWLKLHLLLFIIYS